MVAPIVTGITRRDVKRTKLVSDGNSTTLFCWSREQIIGSKQAKPVDRPLPYRRSTASAKWSGNVFWDITTPAADTGLLYATNGDLDRYLTLARNKAYEKLKSELFSTSQTGTLIAEIEQSASMISARATQALRLAKSVKRLDLTGFLVNSGLDHIAARPLNLRVPRKAQFGRFGRTKSFGNLWLEYHFGWEPMIKDIYEGLEVLTRPIKTLWASERASEPFVVPKTGNNGHPFDLRGVARSSMQSGINVSNQNVQMAASAGLLNPLSIAWELVPYSFVVDWFTNVGQVLGSMTDLFPCELINPYHTDSFRYNWDLFYTTPYPKPYVGNYVVSNKGEAFYMNRDQGIIYPSIALKQLRAPSIVRAATQVSLLAQFLGGKH